MSPDFQIDKLDKAILEMLIQDARISYQEIARRLEVSGPTVHIRINKMRYAGVITGTRMDVNVALLGYSVCAFIGINLVNARDYPKVLAKLETIPQVVEAHYTTGQYSLFAKVQLRSTRDLHLFLVEGIQAIPQIQSTETFISLDTPIDRPLPMDVLLD